MTIPNSWRRVALLIATTFAGASFVKSAVAQENILILVADDLGTDYVGAYGEGSVQTATPNIDALAAQGVLFRNAWANPTCSPTRACIQTGRHGYRTGIGSPQSDALLPDDEVTIPEALDASGSTYAHAYIGKWHLAGNGPGAGGPNHPNNQGWSHFAGLIGGAVADYYQWNRVVDGSPSVSNVYTTTQMVDDALAWIATETGPWICVVAFNAPHTPFHTPPSQLHSQSLPSGNPNQNPIPFYLAAVEAMDTEIGRLLSSLGSDLANTNVIFLGDNGTPAQVSVSPFVSSHAKGSAYEGGVGVPFIVKGPAVVSPNREVDALIHAVDLFATIGDLAGVNIDLPVIQLDSVSIAPYLSNPSQETLRSSIYSESFSDDPDLNGFSVARDVQYKLIRRYGPGGVQSEEFYDLIATPFETVDLLLNLDLTQQAAYATLDAHMQSIRDTTGSFETFGGSTCVGSNGAPMISGSGSPTINGLYNVTLSNAPASSVALFAIGFSNTFDPNLGVALPFDLSAAGAAAGCRLLVSTDWLLTVPIAANGTASVPIAVPNLPILVAGSIYHAWLISDPGAPANPAGVTTSEGLQVVLGE